MKQNIIWFSTLKIITFPGKQFLIMYEYIHSRDWRLFIANELDILECFELQVIEQGSFRKANGWNYRLLKKIPALVTYLGIQLNFGSVWNQFQWIFFSINTTQELNRRIF